MSDFCGVSESSGKCIRQSANSFLFFQNNKLQLNVNTPGVLHLFNENIITSAIETGMSQIQMLHTFPLEFNEEGKENYLHVNYFLPGTAF